MKTSRSAFAATMLVIAVVIPMSTVATSAIFRQLWALLLAPQYGSGPSVESWFGISAIFSLSTWHLIPKRDEDTTLLASMFIRIGGFYFGCGLTFVGALAAHYVMGWP